MSKGGYLGGSTVIYVGSRWFGRGNTKSKPAENKKAPPVPTKPKREKNPQKSSPSLPRKGNGLTISEMVAKAEQNVRRIEGEIARTKQRLAALERDLIRALSESEIARNLPRKSAIGAALHAAEKAKSASLSFEIGHKKGDLAEVERKAERKARPNCHNAPKQVEVEHRVGGKVVSKRIVDRS